MLDPKPLDLEPEPFFTVRIDPRIGLATPIGAYVTDAFRGAGVDIQIYAETGRGITASIGKLTYEQRVDLYNRGILVQ